MQIVVPLLTNDLDMQIVAVDSLVHKHTKSPLDYNFSFDEREIIAMYCATFCVLDAGPQPGRQPGNCLPLEIFKLLGKRTSCNNHFAPPGKY